jgi:excinuclease ABC subunit C
LTRRLKRGLEEEELPDLVIVDGGKGQLSVAGDVFRELNITGIDLVALAKSKPADGEGGEGIAKPERIFLPGRKNPVVLRQNSSEMFLLERIRDESHRFAITFHRQLRGKRLVESKLSGIKGIGRKRSRALLSHFGSFKKLREASAEEIERIPGISKQLAESIHARLTAGD